jgi:hypothetical protein
LANPNVQQGTLNRLIASVSFPSFPGLNITPSFLNREAIRMAFGGVLTGSLPSLTGRVTSPEPYQMVTLTIHLLRSQAFANTWKQQIESSSLLGDVTVRPDVTTMDPWYLSNVSIDNVDAMTFAGGDASFTIELGGIYYVNNSLWN